MNRIHKKRLLRTSPLPTTKLGSSAVKKTSASADSSSFNSTKSGASIATPVENRKTEPRLFDPYTSLDIAGPNDVIALDSALVKAQPLAGRKVAVLVESQFVPQELANYATRFKAYGGDVHFVSRLWGNDELTFHSRYDSDIVPELRSMKVNEDLSTVDLSKGEYAAVIQSVHTQQRLLYEENIVSSEDPVSAARQAPAVQLLEKALRDPDVVVGAFGHGAEVLAPLSDLIKGARLTTSPGSIANLANTGAVLVNPANKEEWTLHNVTERKDNLNLVTAMSILHGGNEAFIDAIARLVGTLREEQASLASAA